MVSVGDTEDAMRRFMQTGRFTFPVVLNGDRVGIAYGVQYIPAVFILDGDGRIVATPKGVVSAEDLSALVDGL